ncbi:plasmid recombination protein, partial [Clostridioides difficile]|uniref:plasmid recombination protein n=1 Tax=Clostridioides difficile TaxID=1496 RepID=UPI002ED63120
MVQVGNMFDSAVGSEQGEICKQILNDYMKSFQERNPNLYVFNAVLHMDEQTPHLHIDYIPIATEYQ